MLLPQSALPIFRTKFEMSTIVEFRLRRDTADAARFEGGGIADAFAAPDPATRSAEIILMPFAVLAKSCAERPRKTLSRRFASCRSARRES